MMDEQTAALEAADAGMQMQEATDEALPAVVGMYSQTGLNALVDAVNQALVAAGFEGVYPEFDGDSTELPAEFVRLLAMLNDAAEEAGVPVNLDLSMLEDDRDLALLASEVAKLASAPEFASTMLADPTADVGVPAGNPPPMAPQGMPPGMGAAPPPQAGGVDEEALMMERM